MRQYPRLNCIRLPFFLAFRMHSSQNQRGNWNRRLPPPILRQYVPLYLPKVSWEAGKGEERGKGEEEEVVEGERRVERSAEGEGGGRGVHCGKGGKEIRKTFVSAKAIKISQNI